MQKYTVGLVQLNSQDDKRENLKKINDYVREGAERGCQVIVFPECSHFVGGAYQSAAEDIPGGETFALLSQLARECGLWIHSGSIYEKNGENRPYNTSFVVNPLGELVTKYRKLHLFDVEIDNGPNIRESERITPGDKIVTVRTPDYGTWGLSICYDLRFPELYRAMTLSGANILFVPANFTMNTGKDHWETLLRARAVENGCYVIAPAQTGKKPNFQSYGKTLVVDPWGTVIACAPERECLVTAEIDLEQVEKIRQQVGTLHNRREDIYGRVSVR